MTGTGPAIWLAGDPEDLPEWLNAGAVAAFQGSDELQELRQQVAAVARAQYARLF